jgi:hypothetical protein
MVWPRSPDLITCDSSFWGTVKEKVAQLQLRTVEDLKIAIRDCFNDSRPSTWRNMSRRTREKLKCERRMEGSIQMTSN